MFRAIRNWIAGCCSSRPETPPQENIELSEIPPTPPTPSTRPVSPIFARVSSAATRPATPIFATMSSARPIPETETTRVRRTPYGPGSPHARRYFQVNTTTDSDSDDEVFLASSIMQQIKAKPILPHYKLKDEVEAESEIREFTKRPTSVEPYGPSAPAAGGLYRPVCYMNLQLRIQMEKAMAEAKKKQEESKGD